ncbi:MAG TPA: cell envelope biogenesis protein OmpA [Candidatus Desulfovibrio intestinipullorum]|uniref:Cell envelope biogenesis protein OmpA n=1 Tax=Candidatus Desulfovibrio intestinipullorum TaxID=2838536 RepID=A0A9D1PVJ3_9BACT|nr:cell envelope biogenesis protein OmpA [Candidatus Desulfovibrio intestinipullorum]
MIRKICIYSMLTLMLVAGAGCTNMSNTQQGVASGAVIGGLGGAGIAAISGGSPGWGALAGAGAGALVGGIVGNQQDNYYRY